MALDVGDARIGVAICDATGTLASPYMTIHVTRDEDQTWQTLQQLLAETEAEGLVIGLPLSMDGQVRSQGERVQAFAERLRPHITVPIIFWDERLSTVEAERLLAQRREDEGGKRQRRGGQSRTRRKRRRQGHEIDALAASIILQDYLNQHPAHNSGQRSALDSGPPAL